MTELMKRYEKETGKTRPSFNLVNMHALLYWYQMFAEWLEAKLTWRPVREKPEESCKCIGKFDDGELYDTIVYYDAKNDLWSRLVHDTLVGWYTSYKPPIKYFIIPPAPEEKS